MKIVLLFIGILLFTTYFYAIGSGYLSFLPFIIFFVLGLIIASNNKDKLNIRDIDNKYIFLGAWILVNISVVVLLYLLGIGILESLLGILGLNIFALIASFPIQLSYATEVSYISFYLACLAIFVYALLTPGISAFLTLEYLLAFVMAFLAFVYFVVPLYYPINDNIIFHFIIATYSTLTAVIYSEADNKYYAILILLILLTIVLLNIKYVIDQYQQPQETKEISVRKILSGERVLPALKKQKQNPREIYKFAQKIIPRFPRYVKYYLEGINITLLMVFLYLYISNANIRVRQLSWIHRGIILSFLSNIYIFKTIQYTSIIQKIGMFLGINIFMYLVLFSILPQISGDLLIYAIGLNILYSFMLYNLRSIFPKLTRSRLDYFTGLGVDILAVITNVILLTYLNFSGQVIFALAFLYITVKVLIILYTLDMIRKTTKRLNTSNQEEDTNSTPHLE